MATANPFDLLGNDENDDPTQLIAAAQQQKLAQPKKPQAPAKVIAAATAPKLPSRPLPPSQAVREEKNETRRGGGPGGRGSGYGGRGNGFGGRGDGFGGRGDGYGGRGRGRDREHGGGGFNRDSSTGDKAFNGNNEFSGGYRAFEDGDNSGRPSDKRNEGPHSSIRGGRRGGYSNGEAAEGDRNRRVYERRSGTGRGSGIKRDGAGRGNWGTPTDEISPDAEEFVNENEKIATAEKVFGEENVADASKDNPENEHEQKELKAEDKEMTLEEYEKLLQEKRKVLQSLKTEERKVDVDKEFGSMQQLSSKKDGVDIFIKLGSEKDKRKEAADKEDRVKKAVSINEFLKPAEGERLYGNTGRGRGRGQGRGRGEPSGGYPSNNVAAAPAIEDPRQFPSLSGK